MQASELKILFHAGQLKSCTAVNHIMSDEWCLQFERKKGDVVLMNAQRVSPRRFKTLDAAYKAARDIGFLSMGVNG